MFTLAAKATIGFIISIEVCF